MLRVKRDARQAHVACRMRCQRVQQPWRSCARAPGGGGGGGAHSSAVLLGTVPSPVPRTTEGLIAPFIQVVSVVSYL